MRLGFGCLALALTLSACAEDKAARLAADWGCGPVEGLAPITGDKAPAWVLVGEFTETSEAPAAVADIACHLATDERKLFVGLVDYFGGATDAETRMIATLEAMISRGAPIIIGHVDGDDHPGVIFNRSKSEKAWARILTKKVEAAGATRALLFLPGADAVAEPIPPVGERFAGYSPMPVFLDGGVISLEVASHPVPGASSPVISIYPAMTNGFNGQLALATLTRPTVPLLMPLHDKPEPNAAFEYPLLPPLLDDTPPMPSIDAPDGRKIPEVLNTFDSPITSEEYEKLYDELLQPAPNRQSD